MYSFNRKTVYEVPETSREVSIYSPLERVGLLKQVVIELDFTEVKDCGVPEINKLALTSLHGDIIDILPDLKFNSLVTEIVLGFSDIKHCPDLLFFERFGIRCVVDGKFENVKMKVTQKIFELYPEVRPFDQDVLKGQLEGKWDYPYYITQDGRLMNIDSTEVSINYCNGRVSTWLKSRKDC